MSIEPFERNEGAYRSAVQMLAERGRAAVIHPTGTGKSFIVFRLYADNPDKRIVWLSPSEYIYKPGSRISARYRPALTAAISAFSPMQS